jgi:hypothetical protein
VPDSRSQRSAAPKDRELLAPGQLVRLRGAAEHLAWLWSRGYGEVSSLALVGDRFELTRRQREAVMRCACSDEALERRNARRIERSALEGGKLAIDGYNVLTTVEAALGGGAILLARDGCARDLASMRGTWRRVSQTRPALELTGQFLARSGLLDCAWYLDSPVSNSGRLRQVLLEHGEARGWRWRVEMAPDADRALLEQSAPVASADRRVLDGCRAWFNLARETIEESVPQAWWVDLR